MLEAGIFSEWTMIILSLVIFALVFFGGVIGVFAYESLPSPHTYADDEALRKLRDELRGIDSEKGLR